MVLLSPVLLKMLLRLLVLVRPPLPVMPVQLLSGAKALPVNQGIGMLTGIVPTVVNHNAAI